MSFLVNLPVIAAKLALHANLKLQGATLGDAIPLRAELLNIEQMELHGLDLAKTHRLNPDTLPNRLLKRLGENERIIADTCRLLIAALQAKRQIIPAEEWLLDNFHLIDDQIRTAKLHLPKGYSGGLPRLLKGPSANLPRIYDIALESVSHSDAQLNESTLSRFLAAYQSQVPLQLGELWAFPIMLRLSLIENLRRVAARLAVNRAEHNLANFWADRMTRMEEEDPTKLILVIADMARSEPPMSGAFVAEIVRRLQGHGAALALPLSWIEQRLSQAGTNINAMVVAEVQQRAADQVSVANSIGSLRFLTKTNWREFIQDVSLVEKTLAQDPSNFYTQMNFATRDRYRHRVESLAKNSKFSENDVAERAIAMAKAAFIEDEPDVSTHVGYYLIGGGRRILEKEVAASQSLGESLRRAASMRPFGIYLTAIMALTGTVSYFLVNAAENYIPMMALLPLGIACVIGASHLAVALVNWLVTVLARAEILPKLDYSNGIPADAATMVVVPSLLTDSDAVDDLCEALEVRYLANAMSHLYFCLLTDFTDSKVETMPGDALLIEQAADRIAALNRKYSTDRNDIFFLFHRPRRWNATEGTWMGYERKRGKLAALNALLRGEGIGNFSKIAGRIETLPKIQYIITLDTDTQLPRDAAWQFIGTMAHPLNRPRYDENKKIVKEGYGIIQPRVSASLPDADASFYQRMFGGDTGIDPYTRAVSDVYQDALHEGSFIGKGIYDIDAFEFALKDRLPENIILSHDLLEGCYARSGLLSDVQLYEAYPSRYSADVARRHRWVRGDWQILNWLFPRVPGLACGRVRNPLSAISRWKIFDNLRRSLVALALTVMLVTGWMVLPLGWLWTGAVIGILFIPMMTLSVLNIARKPAEMSWPRHFLAAVSSAGSHLAHALFTLGTLPYEAFYHTDAILRTGWRMLVSRKKLLEWSHSGLTVSKDPDLMSAFRTMWVSPFTAVLTFFLIRFSDGALLAASPILMFWCLSPAMIWLMSRRLPTSEADLDEKQIYFLRKIARRTWGFFEAHVGPDDNWLPPDNVQEKPVAIIAHRTSPTNMGLSLLANLTAWDFGYISAGTMLARTSNSLQSMDRLERYQGHFYNWYDTKTLLPLNPWYVSTVDSGNLAGHLLTLRQGLLAMAYQPVADRRVFDGMLDTLNLMSEEAGGVVPESLRLFQMSLQSAVTYQAETLGEMQHMLAKLTLELESYSESGAQDDAAWWYSALLNQCRTAHDEIGGLAMDHASEKCDITLAQFALKSLPARVRLEKIEELSGLCNEMALLEYDFLYDQGNHLLAIGYNVTDRKRDTSYYDLLASEARLANFVAIAQGKLPQECWFALGRKLTASGGQPTLLSWSGSMFEYLMPLLVMPPCNNTLLDQTCKAAVQRQIAYGQQRGVPWGISESGYNTFDSQLNYQYRAFGVPGLGLKRGLGDDLVIAPYAAVMALMVAPEKSCENLQRMADEGFSGRFGFYEAVDYTPARIPRGKKYALVQSFMVHHQGMSLLSLSYLLHNRPMQKRFEAEPMFKATMLLLHEKMPKSTGFQSDEAELSAVRTATSANEEPSTRFFTSPSTPVPEVQLLSNGRYHAMVTNAGGSFSRWKDISLTRWRSDATRDNWGTFCYLRDTATGAFWSTSFQPTLIQPDSYEAIFSEGRVEFRRRDQDIETHTEIVVSPEDDIELRRTHITNRSRIQKVIEVTSYAEVVLAPLAADMAHPAFSNLFVQTEILPERQAILCTRRPRSATEQPPWLAHLTVVHGAVWNRTSYETNRAKFIGRGNSTIAPHAMESPDDLSGDQGSVLDPIVSIRHHITLEPEQTAVVDVIIGAADNRATCIALIDKYRDPHMASRVFEMAWSHSHVILRQLNAAESDVQLYGRLASTVLYPNAALRANAATLVENRRGQSGLWSYAISGDLPIVLLQVGHSENIELVRQMVQAHAYWRLKGLPVDLVIWNEDQGGYRQVLQDQIINHISSGTAAHVVDRPGGIFVRPSDQISPEDRVLLESVACAIIRDSDGTLADQVNLIGTRIPRIARIVPTHSARSAWPSAPEKPVDRELLLFNGTGGFSTDGREYVIVTGAGKTTPAPWSNVLANPSFGTVISESGQSYTWNDNAHEFRLTPWHNDPVTDVSGEAIYVRDDETGQFWSPAPAPTPGAGEYETRHGFGYSIFDHVKGGIHTELCVFVAVDSAVKFSVLKVRNESGRTRKLSVTGYVEWVLGDLRSKTGMHIVTQIDKVTGAIFARNPYNTEFADRIAFFDINDTSRSFTCDRREFIGRNGSLSHPTAMDRLRLSGKSGPGFDPCAALQSSFELADGEERVVIFKLGIGGSSVNEASAFVQRFQGRSGAREALSAVRDHWDRTLGAVQIRTPDRSLDILTNGWLMYQTIACRLWARSGYYQSGGAFGFRDQLQDAMAVIHTRPEMLRTQLLLCAGHQFVDGDVQHWWHPPHNRGVRTKCSDDYLWLPLAACRYVVATGDIGVMDEMVHFLDAAPLGDDEDSSYDLHRASAETGTLYEHCVRAIRRGLRYGVHGLPLIGSCDWNDGMDKVGEHGKGESVWLAFFLYDILLRFSKLALLRNDQEFSNLCNHQAESLRSNIEEHGWDGGWYRRAYFDDGTPLGSAENEECQIDSLSQSWSVLSGAADPERSQMAMKAVDDRLVRRDYGLIQLLDPPFDKAGKNPGYIRGYVPGVRENGGQYTHAAIWTAMAFAQRGDGKKAYELLSMINPINHALDDDAVALYKVEPYVIAADVYGVDPHAGRGGWTWYTGSSGWMYRLILESLLGLHREGNVLRLAPCLPPEWHSFSVDYHFGKSLYRIAVEVTSGSKEGAVTIDGAVHKTYDIPMVDDGEVHDINIVF